MNPDRSNLYTVATRYLLPASLVLLTLSVDLREIFRLGPKALVMFVTGTIGVVVGGPLALFIVAHFNAPLVSGPEGAEVWRGMTTVAGSWIGGGANQLAMREIFLDANTAEAKDLFTVMIAVDVIVAEIWMMFLLLGIGQRERIDGWFGADNSSIDRLQQKMEDFSRRSARVATAADIMLLCAIGFGVTGAAHLVADSLAPMVADYVAFIGTTRSLRLDVKLQLAQGIFLARRPGDNWRSPVVIYARPRTRGSRGVKDWNRVHLHPRRRDRVEHEHSRFGGSSRFVFGRRDLDGLSRRSDVPGRLSDQGPVLLHCRWQQGEHRRSRQRTGGRRCVSPLARPCGECCSQCLGTFWAPMRHICAV